MAFYSIIGQPGSKIEIADDAVRNVFGEYPYTTESGHTGTIRKNKLVPYGESTGKETPIGGRPVKNPSGTPWTHRRW